MTPDLVLCGLAANTALPNDLIDQLIDQLTAAARNTSAGGTPRAHVSGPAGALAGDSLSDLVNELADRPDLTHAQAAALASLDEYAAVRLAYAGLLAADDIDPVARPLAALALLDEGAGRETWVRAFATDPDVMHREKLAACPDLPADVTEALASDPDIRVVAELASRTTPAMATRLARHPHADVRRAVAANERTPPAVLAALITEGVLPPAQACVVCDSKTTPFVHDPQCPIPDCTLPPDASCDGVIHASTVHAMQCLALQNPATPAEAAAAFANHPSAVLRWTLASRPGLPPETYARLAQDPVPGIRADLAVNPSIGEPLMRELATDPGHDVQRRLAHNAGVPLDILISLAGTTKTGSVLLPRIAVASLAEVEELAASPYPAVRMLLAARRDLPNGIRDALAADPDAKVLKAVAPHPGLSEVQLRAMVDRHGARVIARVATNPGATPSLLAYLAHQVEHRSPAQKLLREIARHRNATAPALLACLSDVRARPLAAAHRALPPAVIAELLADDDPHVAAAAAANPSLPPGLMWTLLNGR
ncbi:hypothetical protein [Streptomyces sp. NBC_01445]|uniref:hypothetical protein n=1 Tax=Streptomyces sp. NBC_01445 TaxID=2903869 RepID=UPI002DDBC353|nr:hypothetical protein [Streptomyces sp. NBC_01445]WSE05947.1 hypothetical protein OG574_22850 [Streptomyces sp. NBC_01445]